MLLRLVSAVGTSAALLLSIAWISPSLTETSKPTGPTELSVAEKIEQRRLDEAVRLQILQTTQDSLARWESAIAAHEALTRDEHLALQKAPYHEHIDASRRVGVHPRRALRDLTVVRPGSPYYVTGWDGLLAKGAIETLDVIGERFQAELRRQNLPAARFIVTSTHRSAEEQAALTEINANATKGQSSHEFGGSFDIGYNRFLPLIEGSYEPMYELHGDVPPRLLAGLVQDVSALETRWAEQIIVRHTATYDAVLGRVLLDLQAEGRLIPLREYYQPCYHVTAKPFREQPRA